MNLQNHSSCIFQTFTTVLIVPSRSLSAAFAKCHRPINSNPVWPPLHPRLDQRQPHIFFRRRRLFKIAKSTWPRLSIPFMRVHSCWSEVINNMLLMKLERNIWMLMPMLLMVSQSGWFYVLVFLKI